MTEGSIKLLWISEFHYYWLSVKISNETKMTNKSIFVSAILIYQQSTDFKLKTQETSSFYTCFSKPLSRYCFSQTYGTVCEVFSVKPHR